MFIVPSCHFCFCFQQESAYQISDAQAPSQVCSQYSRISKDVDVYQQLCFEGSTLMSFFVFQVTSFNRLISNTMWNESKPPDGK